MASFPNQSEMPSFYWDNVNTTEIINCNHMLGFTRISWKLRIEPKKANYQQNEVAGERGQQLVCQLTPRAVEQGRVQREGSEILQGIRSWATDASDINALVTGMGQSSFSAECLMALLKASFHKRGYRKSHPCLAFDPHPAWELPKGNLCKLCFNCKQFKEIIPCWELGLFCCS